MLIYASGAEKKEMFSFYPSLKRKDLLRFVLSACTALIAGFQLIHFLIWTPEKLALYGVLVDDAYFYSVLAQNFHQFRFLTLNGVMSTNGVQPFWMIIQIILTHIFPNVNGVTLLSSSSWVFYVLFSFLVVWFVSRSPSVYATSLLAMVISGLVVLNVHFQKLVVRGLETPLTLFILVLTLYMTDNLRKKMSQPIGNPVFKEVILLAILSVLVFFSRTDFFWLSVVIGIWLLFLKKTISKESMVYFVTVSVLVIPYITLNYITQNSLIPTSGRAKIFYLNTFYPTLDSYFSSDEWQGLFYAFKLVYDLPGDIMFSVLITASIVIIAFFLVWKLRVSNDLNDFPISIQLFSVAILGHMFYMQFVYKELRPYSSYYFSIEILWAALVGTYYIAHLSNTKKKNSFRINKLGTLMRVLASSFIALSCIGLAISFWLTREIKSSPYSVQRFNLARDIQHLVPENEPVAAFWPGTFAQFSGRKIIPLWIN